MEKLWKVLKVVLILIVLAAAGIFGFMKYSDYRNAKEKQDFQEEQARLLSQIDFIVPDGFVNTGNGIGYSNIAYVYEENQMKAVIYVRVWDLSDWHSSAETAVSSYVSNNTGEESGRTIIEGPKEVNVNGLKGQMIGIEETEVSEEWGVHFVSRQYEYYIEIGDHLYEFDYHVSDHDMFEGGDAQTNTCVTAREPFINSIKEK